MKLAASERLNWTLSAGAVAASWAAVGPHFAGSLALGAALEALNFRVLHRGAQALFRGELTGALAWVALLVLRLGTLLALVGVAIAAGAHPLGLVAGLSVVLPATLWAAWQSRPPVIPAEPAPALAPDDPSWDTYSIWRFREVEREEEDT